MIRLPYYVDNIIYLLLYYYHVIQYGNCVYTSTDDTSTFELRTKQVTYIFTDNTIMYT